jgi:Apea-like HEPN
MLRNEELHQAWKLWLQAVLPRLRTAAFEYYTGIQASELVDQLPETIPKPQDNYFGLFKRMRPHMGWMPEFKSIADIINRTPELKSIFYLDVERQPIEAPEIQLVWLASYCENFMFAYLNIVKELLFVSREFEHVYAELEKFIYSTESFEAIWLIRLRNLISEVDLVPLEQGISLRKAAREDIENPEISITDVLLEKRYIHDRTSTPQFQDAGKTADTVVLALRLIKPDPIGIDSFYWRLIDQPFPILKDSTFNKMVLPSTYQGARYTLTKADADILQALWPKAKKAYSNPDLLIAISRLEDAYSRTKDEDKLLDYWIALEALFLPEKQTRDMAESIALAVSYYIGQTEDSRKSIQASIRQSHELRSHIIHGKLGKKRALEEMIMKTGNYVRFALRKRIEE